MFAKELALHGSRVEPSASSRRSPSTKGVLFVDSADKAARFIWLCDAFDIPPFFGRCARLYDRNRRRASGHHSPRCQDDLCGC